VDTGAQKLSQGGSLQQLSSGRFPPVLFPEVVTVTLTTATVPRNYVNKLRSPRKLSERTRRPRGWLRRHPPGRGDGPMTQPAGPWKSYLFLQRQECENACAHPLALVGCTVASIHESPRRGLLGNSGLPQPRLKTAASLRVITPSMKLHRRDPDNAPREDSWCRLYRESGCQATYSSSYQKRLHHTPSSLQHNQQGKCRVSRMCRC
jgi:hypothetical protein